MILFLSLLEGSPPCHLFSPSCHVFSACIFIPGPGYAGGRGAHGFQAAGHCLTVRTGAGAPLPSFRQVGLVIALQSELELVLPSLLSDR
jgi:hypothetical protein